MGKQDRNEEFRIIRELQKFDSATICNVVATYPESDICLKLYDAWRGEYYTDASLHWIYPEHGPVCGYAATARYSDGKPEYTALNQWALPDLLDRTPKPIVLVAEQTYSPGLELLSATFGGNMTTQFKALGVEGVVTDGPIRDYVEMREMEVAYLATGFTSGHGPTQLRSAGEPVKVAGMSVTQDDIIHMDHCGACKFPASELPRVLEYATELVRREKKYQMRFHEPGFSLQEWKKSESLASRP